MFKERFKNPADSCRTQKTEENLPSLETYMLGSCVCYANENNQFVCITDRVEMRHYLHV